MFDNRRREVQLIAGQHWEDSGCLSTVEIATSIGKTWISLDAMLKQEKGCKVLFLAETTQREKDLYDDIAKYDEIFGTDILNHVELEFACYQSAFRWSNRHFNLVIADEIHSACTLTYGIFFYNNTYDKLLGLSATLRSKKKYLIGTEEYTKMSLLNQIAPVCYVYDIGDAQQDKASRELNIHIIYHNLDKVTRSILSGTKKKPFYTTEALQYRYINDKCTECQLGGKFKLGRMFIAKRANMLYSLPSKIKLTKDLLTKVKGKSILFGNHIDSLELITPNVVRSNRAKESKKLRDALNNQIREDFDNDKIDVIASFNMLVQGANLNKVDNVILMSYYSEHGRFIQQAGRLRKNDNKIGNVYIIVTNDTQEESWYESFSSQIPMEEFNVMYYNNINEIKFE